MLARRSVDPRAPPRDFDALVDWFDQISSNLVLLEEYPREDLGFAVAAFDAGVRQHIRSFVLSDRPRRDPRSDARELVVADHARFSVSLEQLRWSYRILESEDHGGHRQALGQYGQVLTEALRRHRRDERAYLSPPPGTSTEEIP